MYTAVIIGSGFSGLAMGIKLKEKGIENFIILEKAKSLGGTWRENTYPGAECDIPSALYSYSFEPYPYWEYKWSHQDQILSYLKHCSSKYGIDNHVVYEQELTVAQWEETDSSWRLKTKNGDSYSCKNLITAVGQLHYPRIPDLSGKDKFQGISFHSARWDHNIGLTDKRIGVIGNAASAIQFIPELAKEAKSVFVFQRSANWILPKQDRAYWAWEKKLVKTFPLLLKLYRLKLWLMSGALYLVMKNKVQFVRKILERYNAAYLKKTVRDKELRISLKPNYPLGSKRVLFSDNYYTTLNQDYIHLKTPSIEAINSTGITLTNQEEIPLDILVYATGFHTTPLLMNLDIRGRHNQTVSEAWKKEHKSYLGMTMNNFPNFFMMYGPNTNLGHSSIIIMSEANANYISKCIAKMESNNWVSMEVKPSIVDKYQNELKQRLKNMIWNEIDDSWYKSNDGSIPTNWPGRTWEYMRRTNKVDFSNYIVNTQV